MCPTSLLAAQSAIIPQVYRVAQIHSTGFVLHQSAALCVFLHYMYRSRQARNRRGGCEALGRRRAGQLPCGPGQHPPSNMCGVWPYSMHSITYVVTLLFDSQGSIPADCFRSLGGSSRTSGGPMTGHAQAHGPLFPPACSRSWQVPTLLALVTVPSFPFSNLKLNGSGFGLRNQAARPGFSVGCCEAHCFTRQQFFKFGGEGCCPEVHPRDGAYVASGRGSLLHPPKTKREH